MALVLIAGLALWMLGCAYAGYHGRWWLFVLAIAGGIALNTAWMVMGLGAAPLSPPALAAHLGVLMYGVSALGLGWLAGRFMRRLRDSRVERP